MSRKFWIVFASVLVVVGLCVGGTLLFVNSRQQNQESTDGNVFTVHMPDDYGISSQLDIDAYSPVVLEDGEEPTRLPIVVNMTTASKVHDVDEHSLMVMKMSLLGQDFVHKSDSYVVGGDAPATYIQTNEGGDELTGWKVVGGRHGVMDYSIFSDSSFLQITHRQEVDGGYDIQADSFEFLSKVGLDDLILSIMGDFASSDDSVFEKAAKSAYVVYHCDKQGVIQSVKVTDFNYVSTQLTASITWTFDVAPLDDLTDILPPEEVVSTAVVSDGSGVFGTLTDENGYSPKLNDQKSESTTEDSGE